MGTFAAIDEQPAYHIGHNHPADTSLPAHAVPVTTSASAALTDIPLLHSRPSAAAKLYLDFDGDTTATWGAYTAGTTPAYDTDNDPTTFSDGEIASIREVWARVTEKYSPFNIDVTTQDPGALAERKALRVVVGGSGAWLGGSGAGGVAYVGGFYSSWSPNTVFVFENNLGNGHAKFVAEAAAHESGHGFGLQHQGVWTNGSLTSEYGTGAGDGRAPIMGNSYTAARGLWWHGTPSTSASNMQDDLAVLANSSNAFGYRADDFADAFTGAAALTLSGSDVTAAGVIEKTTDADTFSFTSHPGPITLAADVASRGAMLDLKLELKDAAGNTLASADTSSLGEAITYDLTSAGTYYLTIASHGSYGDVGQYTVRGTVNTAPAAVSPKPGDANLDGLVDFADLVVVSQNYGKATPATWAEGDFNADGIVDFNDLTTLAQNYAAPTAASAVVQTDSTVATFSRDSQGIASAAPRRPVAFSRTRIAR